MRLKQIFAGALVAAAPAAAQLTGNMHMGYSKMGYGMHPAAEVLWWLFATGLTILVWLWVLKTWKCLMSPKKRKK